MTTIKQNCHSNIEQTTLGFPDWQTGAIQKASSILKKAYNMKVAFNTDSQKSWKCSWLW